jgi:uncharacterized protein (DUF58 family)
MSLPRRSWGVLLLWVASLVLALVFSGEGGGHRVFLSLTYLFTLLLLAAFLWARLSLTGIALGRQLRSGRAQVGKYVEEQFTLVNGGPLPKLWLEVRDESELPLHRVSRVVNAMAVDEQTYPLPGFTPVVGQLPCGETHRRRTHQVTTNVAGVRDYVPGDTFSRIHWPTTARTGRLIVKEFELDPLSDIWLFLDMERRWHAGSLREELPQVDLPSVLRLGDAPDSGYALDPSSEEYAVAIAASLARHFLERDWALGLVTYANEQRRDITQADRGERQLERILSLLAVTHAEGRVPVTQVLLSDTHHLHRSTTAIVITPCLDQRWVAALAHLTMRGVRPMAVLLDGVTFGAVAPDAQGAERVAGDLAVARVPTYVVRSGDEVPMALSQRYGG